MSCPDALPQVDRVLHRIDMELAEMEGNAKFANAFHIADANLRYFLPRLTPAQTRSIIRDILFHQRMTTLDQENLALLESTRIVDRCNALSALDDGPTIFCTYHLGSYKHLFHFLASRGMNCLLFVSGQTLQKQGHEFLDASNRAKAALGWTGTLDILNAEDKNSILHGLRALRRGVALVLYADGNAGAGRSNDNLVPVEFFGKALNVRTGIAYLSHLSGAAIVPVTCRRQQDNSLELAFHARISPGDGSRESYAAAAMQRIYDILATQLEDATGQWEGWLYVHRYLHASALDNVSALTEASAAVTDSHGHVRDTDRYAVLHFPGLRILLDKDRFSCALLDQSPESDSLHAERIQQRIAPSADTPHKASAPADQPTLP